MITLGPDSAMWFTESGVAKIGRIAPGWKADLVLLDLDHPNWLPLNDPVNQLVHCEDGTAVDIVMIDQVRSGGITLWLKIAGMAEAFNLPVVSHGVPEIHVHLVGAAANGLTVEYMPRLFHLWESVPEPRNGLLDMPTAPGLGLKFDEAAFKKYRA